MNILVVSNGPVLRGGKSKESVGEMLMGGTLIGNMGHNSGKGLTCVFVDIRAKPVVADPDLGLASWPWGQPAPLGHES